MFNTYVRRGGDTTIVKQQPNDAADAARLHGEIRAKAEKEALRVTLDNVGAENEFVIGVVASEYSAASNERPTRAVFRLNGVSYDIRVSVQEDVRHRVRQEIAIALVDAIMKKLEKTT